MKIVKKKDRLLRAETGELILDTNGNPQIQVAGDIIAQTDDECETVEIPDKIFMWLDGHIYSLRAGEETINEGTPEQANVPAIYFTKESTNEQWKLNMTAV